MSPASKHPRRDRSPIGGPGYRVRVLAEPVLHEAGIDHGPQGEESRLPWSEIRCAIAAEVGEPEGVRTIVFDLVVADDQGEWMAFRIDAEPGEDAMALARTVQFCIGTERASASIKSLAIDAIPTRWYPDLESFEAEARTLLDEHAPSRG